MRGKIIKGIAGFYSVHVPGKGVYECKARGILRKHKIRPLIGDNVEVAQVDETKKAGNVSTILERTNHLTRPTVANLDQVMIVFAVHRPVPNFHLLDRFLVMAEANNIDALICFNKTDLVPGEQVQDMLKRYQKTGYQVLPTSSAAGRGIDELKASLYGKTTVFAGPSGVGKSSLLNLIQDDVVLETGKVSEKYGRGKHTTRHVELFCFHDDSYVVDTPGFSSLIMDEVGADQLKYCFSEFATYEPYCKFNGCNHLNEPQCGIKKAVTDGNIAESRYQSYTQLMEELHGNRKGR